MRILVIHSRYQETGGEDSVVNLEMDLLRQEHTPELLLFQNEAGVSGLFQFLFSIWNIFAARRVRNKIKEFKPDLIHVHNWHFASGPIIFHTIAKSGIPVVATLHNYRILCPSAKLFTGDLQFLDSLKQDFPWRAIQKRVYRNSLLLTFWLSLILYVHRKSGTWKLINRYLVPSSAMLPFFNQVSWNFPTDRLFVKHNFTEPVNVQLQEKATGFLYIGRLSKEKGIHWMLEAFLSEKQTLTIIGDGPLKEEIVELTKQYSVIQYKGAMDKKGVQLELSGAAVLVVPSVWQEPFGMVIIESFASGTPVIGSKIGAIAELIQHGYNGFHVEPANTEDLRKMLRKWNTMSAAEQFQMRANALQSYQELYTPQKNLQQLTRIYQSCL